ncbi:MAG TPA: SIMPL domain-containing protein [Steroidobacteraceae bacterium]|nr:SIMPL domain-containing protein [Steroidobacteraceae bacterium]
MPSTTGTTTRRAGWLTLAASLAVCGTAAAHDTMPPPLISVTGEGEVKAMPDMAYVTLGVEARKPSLAEARAQVTTAVERLLALARDLKIDPKLVDSTQLQVQPEYRWNEKDSQRVLLGYVVSRQIEIELRDLERLGPLLERAVSAGANQVGGARLDSSKRKELEREALAKAVEDARLDAEALARAAGTRLGPAYNLTATTAVPFQPKYLERAVMAAPMADAAEQTYAPGEMKYMATVNAQYEIVRSP